MTNEPGSTVWHAPFAGRVRRFELRLGEMGELERLCAVPIGSILVRLATHAFSVADVRESIRLGLMGGGASDAEATSLVMAYVDGKPLAANLALAGQIVQACVAGVPDDAGKDGAETGASRPGEPATSAPSIEPALT